MLDIEALNEQGINVWGKEQKLDRQLDAMTVYGVPETHIWEDHETDKTFNRPEYKKMIRVAQRGDIIVIKSIDRLGRNYTEIRDQRQMITQDIGCGIHVLDMPALNATGDPGDLISRFVTDMILQVLAFVAQNERYYDEAAEGRSEIRAEEGVAEDWPAEAEDSIRVLGDLYPVEIRRGKDQGVIGALLERVRDEHQDLLPENAGAGLPVWRYPSREEDDFADGIEFAMERIEDVVGIRNPYAGNRAKAQERKITSGYAEMGNLTKKERIIRAEEKELKRIVLEKRRAEFRKHFGLDDEEQPRFKKHGKVKHKVRPRQIEAAIRSAENSSLITNIKTTIID